MKLLSRSLVLDSRNNVLDESQFEIREENKEYMRLPDVLKLPDYRNLWIGQTISQLGDSVYMLVFLFMAEKISGNPTITGVIAMLSAIPFVIFSPIAGVIADRVDRRLVMLFADYASAVITLGMAVFTFFIKEPPIWSLGLVAFMLSTVNAFFMPARSAAIPRLVPKEKLVEANGFAMATQQATGLLGIAFSAGILGAVYAIWPDLFFRGALIINGLTFLGSAVFIYKLPSIQVIQDDETGLSLRQFRESWRKIVADMKVGFKAIRNDTLAVIALPMNVLSTLSISGFFVVYVVVNRQWYGGEFWSLALVELSFALVSLLCSLYVSTLTIKNPGVHFAAGIGIIGLLVVGMAFAKPYLVFLLLNAACGFAFPSIVIPIGAYFQTAFPDEVRGRVNSTWSMVSMAAQPLGLMVVAFLLGSAGPELSLIVMGIGMAVAGFAGLLFKGVRQATMPA